MIHPNAHAHTYTHSSEAHKMILTPYFHIAAFYHIRGSVNDRQFNIQPCTLAVYMLMNEMNENDNVMHIHSLT